MFSFKCFSRYISAAFVAVLVAGCLCGCGVSDVPVSEELSTPSEGIAFSVDSGFYSAEVSLEMAAPEDCSIYYTTDGSKPSTQSAVYSDAIVMEPKAGNFPAGYLVRAICVDANGVASDEYTRSFFLGERMDSRFTTPVFSIWGNESDLFDESDGIFSGENYELHGRESEREVYIEALDKDASVIFSQSVGARIYGGYSRAASIKSLKFFARGEYGKKSIAFPLFETATNDGGTVEKYKRLVMRNCGNDFQFAFFRDEFNQILARKAGLCDTEGVFPVVAYINGDYYGFFWLHESYCDSYFKSIYGDGEGEFVVVEGSEQAKDEDKKYQFAVDDFTSTYDELIELDLTDDDNFARVCDFMDVENYLDFYAFNIYVNNKDWPQNNYKCYRYYAAEGESYGEGRFDGRWRFLFHDTDYSYSLYQQKEVMYDYDTFSHIVSEGNERYSPLFAKLLERPELRKYYEDKIAELGSTVLEPSNWEATLDEVDSMRSEEMNYYYKYLDQLKKARDDSIWTFPGRMTEEMRDIRYFIKHRGEYVGTSRQ